MSKTIITAGKGSGVPGRSRSRSYTENSMDFYKRTSSGFAVGRTLDGKGIALTCNPPMPILSDSHLPFVAVSLFFTLADVREVVALLTEAADGSTPDEARA